MCLRNTGASPVDNDRRSRSSTEIDQAGRSTSSPSRHSKLWNSIKRKANRLRSLSKEKEKSPKRLVRANTIDDDSVSIRNFASSQQGSTPNLEDVSMTSGQHDGDLAQSPEFSRGRSEERESEGDSGIAVIENSVSTFRWFRVLCIIMLSHNVMVLWRNKSRRRTFTSPFHDHHVSVGLSIKYQLQSFRWFVRESGV